MFLPDALGSISFEQVVLLQERGRLQGMVTSSVMSESLGQWSMGSWLCAGKNSKARVKGKKAYSGRKHTPWTECGPSLECERPKWSFLKTKAWDNIQIFMLYREVQSQSIQVEEEGMWDREVWKKTQGWCLIQLSASSWDEKRHSQLLIHEKYLFTGCTEHRYSGLVWWDQEWKGCF